MSESNSSPQTSHPHPKDPPAKDTSRRDILVASMVGVLLIGFLIYGFLTMSADVSGRGQTGIIVEKIFLEAPETQFTVGAAGGLRRDELPGRFSLRVQVGGETGPIYRIAVPQSVFESVNEGDSYFFVPTPEAMLASTIQTPQNDAAADPLPSPAAAETAESVAP